MSSVTTRKFQSPEELSAAIASELEQISGSLTVRASAVVAANGSYTANGSSSDLSTQSDRLVLSSLRAHCDAILVGAQTVRAERYRAPAPNIAGVVPEVAIISDSCAFDDTIDLFSSRQMTPTIYTSSQNPSTLANVKIQRAADPFSAAIKGLLSDGAKTILCEGGPTLLREISRRNLVDEWFVSYSNRFGDSEEKRSYGQDTHHRFTLKRVWICDDFTFARYTAL